MRSARHQLALPLPRPRADRPLKRAKRDWSEDEFLRALARNGVTIASMDVDVGLFFLDRDGRKFEAVVRRNPLRIAKRATLAKILRARGGGERVGAGTESATESNRGPNQSRIKPTKGELTC